LRPAGARAPRPVRGGAHRGSACLCLRGRRFCALAPPPAGPPLVLAVFRHERLSRWRRAAACSRPFPLSARSGAVARQTSAAADTSRGRGLPRALNLPNVVAVLWSALTHPSRSPAASSRAPEPVGEELPSGTSLSSASDCLSITSHPRHHVHHSYSNLDWLHRRVNLHSLPSGGQVSSRWSIKGFRRSRVHS
jgi:hypothetical protein